MSEKNPYKKCALFDEYKCGLYRKLHGLVKVTDLLGDMNSHLANLKFKDYVQNLLWSERKVIENSAKKNLNDDSEICQFHRSVLGEYWQQRRQCMHHLHPSLDRGKRSSPTQLAPMWLVTKLNSEIPFSFPIGGRNCRKHLEIELQTRKESKELPFSVAMNEDYHSNNLDEIYRPEELNLPEELQIHASTTGRNLTETLGISPIPFQISKTPINRLSKKTLKTLKRKLVEVQEESIRCFAKSVAPSQSDELLAQLNNISDSEEDHLPPDLAPLVPIYMNSDPKEKLIVLSLVDHSLHTKSELMEVFSCLKDHINKARKLKASGIVIPPKVNLHRNRMNTFKMEHFIEFIFASGLIQDVAYGVTTLNFESGDNQTIPHAVLTAKYSHTIAFYLQYCSEIAYEPLSERSLLRILKALKPSQRKSLAGLDDITAAGMNGFEKMKEKQHKDIIAQLERGKRYLKTVYQTHCSIESTISSHNSAFALSTSEEEPSLDVGDNFCQDCYDLASALQKCLEIASSEGVDDSIYDINRWVDDIIKYWKHQIRDYQQRQAKTFCFEQLDEDTAFWLKDFGQKVLPVRYREGQREYFGKKRNDQSH